MSAEYGYPLAAFADAGYGYRINEEAISAISREVSAADGALTYRGGFAGSGIEMEQVFRPDGTAWIEQITLRNPGHTDVKIHRLEIGFLARLARPGWRLCAVPFRRQLDGSLHDYPVEALVRGEFANAVYRDHTRVEPLDEDGVLRSEAWAWGDAEGGLLIAKYNNAVIEYSVACPRDGVLRFGGAGFCLYSEPSPARRIAAGGAFTFGETRYEPYQGDIREASYRYRRFLERKGHGYPSDYDPPVNWNELYDIGWHHSDAEQLRQCYTREALLREAEKARDCGCDMLYLDPGWEVVEGWTRWDSDRLGPVEDLIVTLKHDFGLDLGFRTVLRNYRAGYWPERCLILPENGDRQRIQLGWGNLWIWEMCLCDREFFEAKLEHILAIARHGVKFMMFDEMDWRRPCHDPAHGHPLPSTPHDHIQAVMRLCREVRRRCPGLVAETHDPVWPWYTSRYLPVYFQQGFGDAGSFDENWGFEYMWNCLNDLQSGKAMALYYYNLACSIPLYLHISMAADNPHAVFFWWAASTVRHLGIGGKDSSASVEIKGRLSGHEPEGRFAVYKEQMRMYKRLKPWFARGVFHGLAEHAHLHTLPGVAGGVVNLFNLTDTEQEIAVMVPRALLHAQGTTLTVTGAAADWGREGVTLRRHLPAMAPAVVEIGTEEKGSP